MSAFLDCMTISIGIPVMQVGMRIGIRKPHSLHNYTYPVSVVNLQGYNKESAYIAAQGKQTWL